jgi:hypothetical protein
MRQALTFSPEDAMLAEIFLLRLETELRATQKAAKEVHVQSVPVALSLRVAQPGYQTNIPPYSQITAANKHSAAVAAVPATL